MFLINQEFMFSSFAKINNFYSLYYRNSQKWKYLNIYYTQGTILFSCNITYKQIYSGFENFYLILEFKHF